MHARGVGGEAGHESQPLVPTDGPRVVMCDQVTWELLSLSIASWNAVLSFGLMAIWISAVMRAKGSSRTA